MFWNRIKKWGIACIALLLACGVFCGGKKEGQFVSADNFSKAQIQTIIADAREKINGLYDVNRQALEGKIQEASGYLNASNLTAATQTAYEIMALSGDNQPVTARSVWHRPTEKTLAELEQSLDIYQEIGVNLVYVETFYHGYSMFKSSYVPYYSTFETANYGQYDDYLQAFSALANERGIETHAWVENFYIGIGQNTPFMQEHSGWVMYNNEITGSGSNRMLTYLQRSETGYIFIDPANPNVCNFLIDYYKELLQKNPLVKGLNLDYIRYPVSTQELDTGYTRYSMYGFAQSLGRESELNAFAPLVELYEDFQNILSGNYTLWCNYRTGLITNFVERIRMEVKGDSDLVLSTAVFASLSDTIAKKKQDWKTWFNNGWINVATPMAYLDTAAQVQSAVTDMISVAGQYCYYYTGLASSYRNFPAYYNVTQIQASYDGGSHGYAIFCATQVLGMTDVQQMLKLHSNGKTAVLPHEDMRSIIDAYVTTLQRRAEEIYIPNGAMSATKKTALLSQLQVIADMPCDNAAQTLQLRNAIQTLNNAGFGAYASGNAVSRINELMADFYRVVSIRYNALVKAEALFPATPDVDSGQSSMPGSSNQDTTSNQDPALSSNDAWYLSGCVASVPMGVGAVGVVLAAAFTLLRRKKIE